LAQVALTEDPDAQRELGRKIRQAQIFLSNYGHTIDEIGKPKYAKREPRQFKHVEAKGFKVRGLRKAMHVTVKAAHRTWYGVHRTW